jgi:hypothetical protein
MRQVHRAGEKLFVDYAGTKLINDNYFCRPTTTRTAGLA